jgi:uncharacterized protein (TIGR02391 family)
MLGMHLLWRLVEEGADRTSQGRQDFIGARAMEVYQARRQPQRGMSAMYSYEAMRAEPAIARALSEAWEWLAGEELVAVDAVAIAVSEQAGSDPYFVTRWGVEVAAEGTKGLDLVRARRRLGLELHPRLVPLLRRLIRVGAFEQAAFTALREVEQAVAELAGIPTDKKGRKLRGDALMTAAFNPDGGLLTDAEVEFAEQQGQMNLFKGAFAVFRNPLGHRTVEFEDPTEAAEVVLFADLLMRQLDQVKRRMKAR